MFEIKMTVTGREKLNQMPQVVRQIIDELANEAELHMKSIAPYNKGRLRGSIRAEKRGTSAIVGPHVKYGAAQEFGLPGGPGRYVPAIGKRLRPSMRGWWPGFKGKGYVKDTREHIERNAPAIVDAIIQSHFGGV